MSYEGYVTLVKGGNYVQTAKLVHLPIFMMGDTAKRDKVFTNVNKAVLEDLAKKTGTKTLKGTDYIYRTNDYGKATYRFNVNVAQQCAAFVRNAFFKRSYESMVPALTPKTKKLKARLLKKLGKKNVAYNNPSHIGILFGSMAKNITAFRTNIRSSTDETKHVGYVVGIQSNLKINDTPTSDRRKKAEFRFKKFDKAHLKKQGKLPSKKEGGEDPASYLANRLSWLEFGRSASARSGAQKPRKLYSIAIGEFLKTAGFELENPYMDVVAEAKKSGGKPIKAKAKKGSKLDKELAVVKSPLAALFSEAAGKEVGLHLTKTRKS